MNIVLLLYEMLLGKTGLVNNTGETIIPLTSGISDMLPLSSDFKVIFTFFDTDPDIGYVTDYTGVKLSNKSYSYAALQPNNKLIYAYKYGIGIKDSVVDVFESNGKIKFDDKFSNLTDLDSNNLYTFSRINEDGVRFMDANFNELPDMYIEGANFARTISDKAKTPNNDMFYSVTFVNSDPDNNIYDYYEKIYRITTIINPDTSGGYNFIFAGICITVIAFGIILCKKYRI